MFYSSLVIFVKNLQTYSSAVQAFASIILFVVTAAYVCLTFKILHSPYKAFVVVISVESKKKGWALKVKNLGPGIANNLQIRNVTVTFLGFDPIKKGNVWLKRKISLADGPFFLMPNEEGEYSFKTDFISSDGPFYLTWRTITEKKQKSAWMKREGSSDNFIPLNFAASIKEKVNWYKIILLLTWYRLKKWRNSKKTAKL